MDTWIPALETTLPQAVLQPVSPHALVIRVVVALVAVKVKGCQWRSDTRGDDEEGSKIGDAANNRGQCL